MYTDKKMLELIEYLKSIGKIRYDNEFCEAAGLKPQNLIRIKQGLAHFTPDHIRNICEEYRINANWVFELETTIFRRQKRVNVKVNTNKN